MRRIPEGAILEEMLKKGLATDALIRRVAGVVAGFHSSADTNAHVSRFGSLEAIKGNASENFSQTRGFISKTISEAAFDRIKAYTEGFLRDNSGLLEERVKRGFIRDCHGDLHLEHIAVDKDIVAFDCIEFSERYRFSDTIADIAFLSMDIDFHNRHDLSIALEDSYIEGSGDTEGRALLNFYKCYRAYVRGKVDGLKSMEGEVGEDERFSSCLSATRHFQLSSMYAKGGFRPELLIFCGLSGAGKTTLANEAERRLAFVRLSSDAIRKGLLCMPVSAKAPAPYKQGIYTDDFTDKTYKELIKRAGGFLRQGISVALDATFQRERFLRQAMEEAKAGGLKPEDVHIVLCTADDEMARENILRREREGHGLSDAGWDVYQRQKSEFEPILEPRLKADARAGLKENLLCVLRAMAG
jgi:predicted kinase